MTAVTCPACHGPAEQRPDGVIVCDDGDDRHEMGPAELASIRQAQALVGSIKAGMPVRRALELWGGE